MVIDGYMTVLIVLMPLNYILESHFTGKFCMCFYPIKAIILGFKGSHEVICRNIKEI